MRKSIELIRCESPKANEMNVCTSAGFIKVDFTTAEQILKNMDGQIDFPNGYDIELFQLLERPIFIEGENDPCYLYTLLAAGITWDEEKDDFVSDDYQIAIYSFDLDNFIPCKVRKIC